jgi:hypothetical protein
MAEMAAEGRDGDMEEFVSAPAVILRNLIKTQFPVTSTASQARGVFIF